MKVIIIFGKIKKFNLKINLLFKQFKKVDNFVESE
jgi:hypothetical protein